MHKPENKTAAYGAREYWTEGIDMPGAGQMQYMKDLILSKSYFDRVPDQSLIAGENGEKYEYQIATKGNNYALIYAYLGDEIDVNMGVIAGEEVEVSWFNPRNGEISSIGKFENKGEKSFDPPGEAGEGNDWVLVLDSVE